MSNVVSIIEKEAWDAARLIDSCIEQVMLEDFGLTREKNTGNVVKCIAQIVQDAIDKTRERRPT